MREPGTGSEFTQNTAFGVLDLTLTPTSFDWRFVDVEGNTLDVGTQDCT